MPSSSVGHYDRPDIRMPEGEYIVSDRLLHLITPGDHFLRPQRRSEALRTLGPAAAIVCVSEYLAGEVASVLPVTFVGRVVPDTGVHVLAEVRECLADDDALLARTAADCLAAARARDWRQVRVELGGVLQEVVGTGD